MIRVGEKSQAEIAELFNVDRSTISRMMKELRESGTAESRSLIVNNRDNGELCCSTDQIMSLSHIIPI